MDKQFVPQTELLPEVVKEPEVPSVKGERFDLEEILPIAVIRAHIKALDVPTVTDAQLELYRKGALEAAEQYSGLMLSRTKQYIQDGSQQQDPVRMRRFIRLRLDYPVADGIVHLYGDRQGFGDQTLHVRPGDRSVKVPVIHETLDYNSCCRPCNMKGTNYGMKLMYKAGYSSVDDIPAGIKIGMLKYIAWNVENPGDELLSMRNGSNTSEGGVQGTNNASWASGALELWRQYIDDLR